MSEEAPVNEESCYMCDEVADEESHEINGRVVCFECYEDTMDEALFGDPFGEW